MNGLVVSRPSARRLGEVDPGGRPRGIQGVALLEHLLRGDRVVERRPCSSLLIRASFSRRGTAFSRVCRSARISSVWIVSMSPLGRDLAVDVHDVAVLEGPHDLADRVGLADVGEELVAQPLPLGRAADDAGDVDEATPWPGGSSRCRRSRPARRAARRAAGRRPRWARSSRTGSSPRARCSWSAR